MTLTFKLRDVFVGAYANSPVDWGFGLLSEMAFLRSYSREKEGGGKERWHETCRRVIEGMYSIQKDYIQYHNLPWDEEKATASAEEAYDRMFNFKWTPSGRGLFAMGTEKVNGDKDSSPLYNCFMVSTKDMHDGDPTAPFAFLMDASMMGGGVGFDTLGSGSVTICNPAAQDDYDRYTIPDSREGWVNSVTLLLLSYFHPGRCRIVFDYSKIRPYGEPIKGFGGIAPGPEPLIECHRKIRHAMERRMHQRIDSQLIIDLMNIIGVAVVSGNVRRSAEIAFGEYDDDAFWTLKDYEKHPERAEFGWMSNNTVKVEDGIEPDYERVVAQAATNGEPGLFYLDTARAYGRMADAPDFADSRIVGANPCGEIGLESYEACNLSETYLNRAESMEDFHRTLKFAYLYNKTVTLLSTHWQQTNAVQLRNRRIGCSITGTAQFVDEHGYVTLARWMDSGYGRVREYDRVYSEWLCVRESIRVTTSKPSGTVSLLAGATPGVHWPTHKNYIRRMTFDGGSPIVEILRNAGYTVEDSVYTPGSVVVEIPVQLGGDVRHEKEVHVHEKIGLVALVQKWWADNMVSNTITFDPDTESAAVASALRIHDGDLKSISLLPYAGGGAYQQMPYEELPEGYVVENKGADLTPIYEGDTVTEDAELVAGCDGDRCII